MTARFSVGASTHPGMVRPGNEDAFVAEPGLYVVADGMGGHQAGEVASALAVTTMRDAKARGVRSVEDVEAAVRDANSAIRQAGMDALERAGMGTTITGIVVLDPDDADGTDGDTLMVVANVGDSRTYLWRDRRLRSITVDHSYVQELVSTGQITEQEARLHPRRNIVTRALGIDGEVRVDTWTMPAVRGDRFVICSDGLIDEVPDHEIAVVVEMAGDPQEAADRLVAMANRHGGRDNITVIVVDVVEGADPLPETLPEPQWAEGVAEPGQWLDSGETAVTPSHGMSRPGAGDASSSAGPNGTQVLPVTASAAGRASRRAGARRIGVPQLLYGTALGAVLMVVIVVVLVALTGSDDAPDDPTPTTVAVTATTAGPATTRPALTTTTIRATTTTTRP